MAAPHPHFLFVFAADGHCVGYLATWSRAEVTSAAVHALYVDVAAVVEWCEVSCRGGQRFVPGSSMVEVPRPGGDGG